MPKDEFVGEDREGMLDRPEFGPIPPKQPGKPFRVSPWMTVLSVVREHPNQAARIAIYEKGPPEETSKRVSAAMTQIYRYLQMHYPLEAWEISTRRVPDTWSRRDIWATYHGELTLEEAQALRRIRKSQWDKKMTTREERLRIRDAKERMIARAQVKGLHKD